MRLPLQLVVTNHVSLTPDVAAELRDKAAQLQSYCERLEGCRVTVEAPARHHRLGAFRVSIDLKIPGERLLVKRQRADDLQVVLRDAFQAARRQLESITQRQRQAKRVPPRRLVA